MSFEKKTKMPENHKKAHNVYEAPRPDRSVRRSGDKSLSSRASVRIGQFEGLLSLEVQYKAFCALIGCHLVNQFVETASPSSLIRQICNI